MHIIRCLIMSIVKVFTRWTVRRLVHFQARHPLCNTDFCVVVDVTVPRQLPPTSPQRLYIRYELMESLPFTTFQSFILIFIQHHVSPRSRLLFLRSTPFHDIAVSNKTCKFILVFISICRLNCLQRNTLVYIYISLDFVELLVTTENSAIFTSRLLVKYL